MLHRNIFCVLRNMNQVDQSFGARGSIGTWPAMPKISSAAAATDSSFASSRAGATSCSPTGRPDAVKPHGTEIAGQPVSVIAATM